MLTRADIFGKITEWRPKASIEWVTAGALRVGRYTDGLGVYHPEFVLNFGQRPEQGSDFSDLHFGSRFVFHSVPDLAWINEQNCRLRFTKLTLENDSVLLTADLYGPDEALQIVTFEGTFILFDQALVIIHAMATNQG